MSTTPQNLRVVAVGGTRSPYGVVLMIACVVSGIAGLIPHEARGFIDQLDPGYSITWHIGLLVGAAVALTGMFLRLPTSLLVERAGAFLLAMLMCAYGSAIYFLVGWGGVRTGGIITVMFGLAAAARVVQIHRDLRTLRQVSQALDSAVE